MANTDYEFLTTIYDKEELRITLQSLSEGNVRFKLNDKSNPTSGRAPLSTYFEVDIHVEKSNYASAIEIVQEINK
jgi:hypothetical protein